MALAPPSDYDPPERAPASVEVDGVRIPIVGEGITTDIRKEGPAHITRHATGVTRYEIDGNFYGEWLNTDLQSGYKPVRIKYRDHRFPDEWVTVMHGFLGAYGGEDNRNVRFEVRDPAQLLNEIPASVEFGDAFIEDVLRYVADTYESEQNVYDTVLVSTDVENSQVYNYGLDGQTVPVPGTDDQLPVPPFVGFDNVLKKSFKANRHSLRDVLKWAQDRAKFRYWFQPTENDSTIVLRVVDMDDLHSFTAQHTGSELGGTLDLVTNNALYQISPKNALEVTGGAIGSRDPQVLDSQWQVETPPQKAVTVTVQADPLVKRAGGQLVAEQFNKEFATEQAVENYARSQLKTMLDNASGGQITSQLAPLCSPFDRIKAQPVSQNVTQQDVPALTYEIERVVHKTPSEKPFPFTQYDVSFWIDPRDISVTDVSWQEV